MVIFALSLAELIDEADTQATLSAFLAHRLFNICRLFGVESDSSVNY